VERNVSEGFGKKPSDRTVNLAERRSAKGRLLLRLIKSRNYMRKLARKTKSWTVGATMRTLKGDVLFTPDTASPDF